MDQLAPLSFGLQELYTREVRVAWGFHDPSFGIAGTDAEVFKSKKLPASSDCRVSALRQRMDLILSIPFEGIAAWFKLLISSRKT